MKKLFSFLAFGLGQRQCDVLKFTWARLDGGKLLFLHDKRIWLPWISAFRFPARPKIVDLRSIKPENNNKLRQCILSSNCNSTISNKRASTIKRK